MILTFIEKNLKKAKYEIMEDGAYFGTIPELKGVWASNKNLEQCRQELVEVLEEWIVLKLKDDEKIPGLSFNFQTLKLNLQHAY